MNHCKLIFLSLSLAQIQPELHDKKSCKESENPNKIQTNPNLNCSLNSEIPEWTVDMTTQPQQSPGRHKEKPKER